MLKQKFTKAFISKIPQPKTGKRTTAYDSHSRGLCVIVTPTGVRSFYVLRKVNGKTERVFLGRFPDTTVEQARKRAAKVNSDIDAGINPNDIKRAKRVELTLDSFFELYMERHIEPNRRRPDNVRINYKYLDKLGNKKLSEITPDRIRRLLTTLSNEISKTTANKAHTLLRAIFNKAIEWEYYQGSNPANAFKRFPEKSRERFLLPDELPKFIESLQQESNELIRDFILILLVTGARRREAQSMKWEHVDFGLQIWTIPDTKNGEPRIIPLVKQAVAILKRRKQSATGDYVFPGNGKSGHLEEPKKAWYRILKRAGIKDLRLHDLRRTFGSWMTINGANIQIVGKALGHKDISSTAIYSRLNLEPVREVATTAANQLLESAGSIIDENYSVAH